MSRTIFVDRVGGRLEIASPYAARVLVKSIPRVRWNPSRKTWTAPADLEEDVRLVLADWPGRVSWNTDPPAPRRRRPQCVICRQDMTPLGDGANTHPGCSDTPHLDPRPTGRNRR